MVSDDVRIRAEGACEVLEGASFRFGEALSAWRSGRPSVVPTVSAEEAEALASVKRLDATHVSVKEFEQMRSELAAAVTKWTKQFGFTPTPEQLPVRFSGSMWRVSLILLRANVVVTARELIVGSKHIALDSIRSMVIEAGTHLIVEHEGGDVTLTPDDEAELEMLRDALR